MNMEDSTLLELKVGNLPDLKRAFLLTYAGVGRYGDLATIFQPPPQCSGPQT